MCPAHILEYPFETFQHLYVRDIEIKGYDCKTRKSNRVDIFSMI